MRGDESAELDDERCVVSEVELGLNAVFLGFETELVEPRDLGLREVLVSELRQGWPAPERERLVQEPRRVVRFPVGESGSARYREPLELVRVEAVVQ